MHVHMQTLTHTHTHTHTETQSDPGYSNSTSSEYNENWYSMIEEAISFVSEYSMKRTT
jgi:hypothetical protein